MRFMQRTSDWIIEKNRCLELQIRAEGWQDVEVTA